MLSPTSVQRWFWGFFAGMLAWGAALSWLTLGTLEKQDRANLVAHHHRLAACYAATLTHGASKGDYDEITGCLTRLANEPDVQYGAWIGKNGQTLVSAGALPPRAEEARGGRALPNPRDFEMRPCEGKPFQWKATQPLWSERGRMGALVWEINARELRELKKRHRRRLAATGALAVLTAAVGGVFFQKSMEKHLFCCYNT